MWIPDPSKLRKVRLHSDGEDVETPWAEDRGPAPTAPGARYLRLGNVPFLHAKPTYGDVIIGVPGEDGLLTWDRGGIPFERIGERIAEDGGRWAMILDYVLEDPAMDVQAAFSVLDRAGQRHDIAVEGCYAPRAQKPGRAYLAVPAGLGVAQVLVCLEKQALPMSLVLVHPREDDEP